MKQKYYKAVSLRNGTRTSLVLKNENLEKYTIEYKPYTWISKIKNTLGIFVFSSLESACHCAGVESEEFEVWECFVENPKPVETICGSFEDLYFDKFYYDRINKKAREYGSYMISSAPANSFTCNKIKMAKLMAYRQSLKNPVIKIY